MDVGRIVDGYGMDKGYEVEPHWNFTGSERLFYRLQCTTELGFIIQINNGVQANQFDLHPVAD